MRGGVFRPAPGLSDSKMKNPGHISSGENYTAVDAGPFESIGDYTLVHPRTGIEYHKLFLKEPTGSTGTEISIQSIAPHTGLPYLHTHKKNEETYIVLRGSGVMEVDGRRFPVREGSVVRIASGGMRGIANDSDDRMVFMVIQSRENSLEEYSSADGTPFPVEWQNL